MMIAPTILKSVQSAFRGNLIGFKRTMTKPPLQDSSLHCHCHTTTTLEPLMHHHPPKPLHSFLSYELPSHDE
ncbi:unnamed protein product [Lupinus luteus]|uniref:Uncharacterized protein n=1 Tax=Lupinus luteus TaxID=3873 RepID=A0AAV1Y0E3_LUPLU